MGSAWMPWERPMVGVILCSKARVFSAAEHLVDIGDQQVGGAGELHVEAGVEHVGGGHALVDEARLGADDLGQVGQEGDDVVLDLALDLVDARRRRRWRPCALAQIVLAASFGMTPSSASASAAWASISNQILKRVCGSQIAAISGRV